MPKYIVDTSYTTRLKYEVEAESAGEIQDRFVDGGADALGEPFMDDSGDEEIDYVTEKREV